MTKKQKKNKYEEVMEEVTCQEESLGRPDDEICIECGRVLKDDDLVTETSFGLVCKDCELYFFAKKDEERWTEYGDLKEYEDLEDEW
ncbi:MAG: hypothetical protein ACTSR2_00460 [Candidatus Hodarchaeales archaeon]